MNFANAHIQEKQLGVVNVKIAQFQVPFMVSSQHKRRYSSSSQSKRIRSRENTRTPLVGYRREKMFDRTQRNTHSSHEKRLSNYLENQIHQLYQQKKFEEHLSPVARQKINELKSIMKMKSFSMKMSQMAQNQPIHNQCHFTQYKMSQKHENFDSNLLHSRNTRNSPFARSTKAKKLIARSTEIKKEEEENKFKSIEVGKESKYGQSKKIVLLGGAMKAEFRNIPNPQSRSAERQRTGSRSNYFRHLRQINRSKPVKQLEGDQNNDCKPWQTNKDNFDFC